MNLNRCYRCLRQILYNSSQFSFLNRYHLYQPIHLDNMKIFIVNYLLRYNKTGLRLLCMLKRILFLNLLIKSLWIRTVNSLAQLLWCPMIALAINSNKSNNNTMTNNSIMSKMIISINLNRFHLKNKIKKLENQLQLLQSHLNFMSIVTKLQNKQWYLILMPLFPLLFQIELTSDIRN